MPDEEIIEERTTLELVVPLELNARWTTHNTNGLSGALQLAGFGPEGANLRFVKNGKIMTVYVRGTGLPEDFQEAVVAAIDGYLADKTGFSIKMREIRLEEL